MISLTFECRPLYSPSDVKRIDQILSRRFLFLSLDADKRLRTQKYTQLALTRTHHVKPSPFLLPGKRVGLEGFCFTLSRLFGLS